VCCQEVYYEAGWCCGLKQTTSGARVGEGGVRNEIGPGGFDIIAHDRWLLLKSGTLRIWSMVEAMWGPGGERGLAFVQHFEFSADGYWLLMIRAAEDNANGGKIGGNILQVYDTRCPEMGSPVLSCDGTNHFVLSGSICYFDTSVAYLFFDLTTLPTQSISTHLSTHHSKLTLCGVHVGVLFTKGAVQRETGVWQSGTITLRGQDDGSLLSFHDPRCDIKGLSGTDGVLLQIYADKNFPDTSPSLWQGCLTYDVQNRLRIRHENNSINTHQLIQGQETVRYSLPISGQSDVVGIWGKHERQGLYQITAIKQL
jgi:hypothetical protein